MMQTLPIKIVGSSVFGRYPKISLEKTYNMIISDDWLVPFAGHKQINNFTLGQEGRGLYASIRFQRMVSVIDNNIYLTTQDLTTTKIDTIDTYSGDVFIAENNAKQIAFCDKSDIYILDYGANTFTKIPNSTLGFLPGYICFQNTYFIAPDRNSAQWRLSANNNGMSWPSSADSVGSFQTKADTPRAAIPMPGKGNLLLVFGATVTEPWFDVGLQLFPYQKNTSYNIDYGCLNPATIAWLENFVVWLGGNETAGATIMYSDGGAVQQLSSDGINFLLASLRKPEDSYGFLYRQDGHVLYQLTFVTDNLTLLFDFETKKFFHLCDEYMNYHIAKKVVSFDNSYYFISINDGNIYELNSKYTTYNGNPIPRVRMCPHVRLPDSSAFIGNEMGFTLEQGDDASFSRIDLTVSKDGGASFSNAWGKKLNALGRRPNRLRWFGLGRSNDLIPQFRFWGNGRFVAQDGYLKVYQ